MTPVSGIILLSCIYWGALLGGAITSILFNIRETLLSRHPLRRLPDGEEKFAGQAPTAAFTPSFVGALVTVLMNTFLAPLLAKLASKFGPTEFFAVQLLTFCSSVGTSKDAPWKTFAAMFPGFSLAAIGMDKVTGQLRLNSAFAPMVNGFDFLMAVIGLFAIGENLLSVEEGLAFKGKDGKIDAEVISETWQKLPHYRLSYIPSATVGC